MEENQFFASMGTSQERLQASAARIQKTTSSNGVSSSSDEAATRAGANIVFAVSVIFAIIFIIVGFVILSGGGMGSNLGVVPLIFGVLFALVGWITRAFIRLFANMSEKLSSIDKKLNR